MSKLRYFIVATNEAGLHLAATQKLDDVREMFEIPSQVFDGNRIWRSQTVGSIFEDIVEELEPDRPSENGTEEWNKSGPF